MTKAEAEIERLAMQIATIDRGAGRRRRSTPRDPARAQALARERGELVRAREAAEAAWLAASEAYEAAASIKDEAIS